MQFFSRLSRTFLVALLFSFAIFPSIVNSQSMPALPENQLRLAGATHAIPFIWLGDSVSGKWEPHAALLIPVRLQNCPKQFYMQFDLGAPYSLFYSNKLKAIRLMYPAAISQDITKDTLFGFSFKAARMDIHAKEIVLKQFDSSGISWQQGSTEIIGTLGSDLIDGRTVLIDYPAKKISFHSTIPKAFSQSSSLYDFRYIARRVLLPAGIQGKQGLLYFDTGSSMFELLLGKQDCEALSVPGSLPQVSEQNSWGKILKAYSLPSNDSVDIAGQHIRLHSTTYIEGTASSQVSQMKRMGITGMTGNKLFLQYRLLLDTRAQKFGLMHVKHR